MGCHSLDELLQIYGLKFDVRVLENTMRMSNRGYYSPKPEPVSSYEVDGIQYEVYDEGEI